MYKMDLITYKYFTVRRIDIFKYLDNQSLNILRKFGIFIENRLYTEFEFDSFDEELFEYYVDPDNDETRLPSRSLSEVNVSKKEYDKILNIFLQISNDYESAIKKLIL